MTQQVGARQQTLPLEYLIGAPLQAIVRAQDLMSQAALDFVADMGLVPPRAEPTREPRSKPLPGMETPAPAPPLPTVRLLEFQYSHPVPDPENPGLVLDTPVHVKVPLLSLLQLPNLRIDEATLDLNVRIAQIDPVPAPETQGVAAAAVTPRFELQSAFAPRTSETSPAGADGGNLKISIRLKEQAPAEGTRIVSDLLRDSIVSHPLGPPPASAPPPAPAKRTTTSGTKEISKQRFGEGSQPHG